MNEITYEHWPTGITVKLEGKKVGDIKATDDGFVYIPKGQKTGGEIFKTIREVKASIEGS